MIYTIIGNDGKKYGPSGAEQIRQWIKQGRVESRTPVFVQGAADWTFVGLLPEFAGEFSGSPPPITPSGPGASDPCANNHWAIWGFICGILGWTCCCCGCCLPIPVLGLIFSIIALVQINSQGGASGGRGLAIAGIVLSATSLLWSFGMTLLELLNNSSPVQWNFVN